MTLSKTLVAQSAPDIFIVFQDFQPRPRPDLSKRVEERIEKWVRAKEAWRKHEDTWEATKRQVGRSSKGARRKQEERKENRMRQFMEKREEAWKVALENEEDSPPSSAWDDNWTVPWVWRDTDNVYELGRLQEDKKRVDTNAREQLRELGVIKAGKESTLGTGRWGDRLERVKMDLWDNGWLARANDEYRWMKKNLADHPEQWEEKTRLKMHLWWNDVRGWTERWRWRNDVIDEFERTSADLLLELEKIDGTASARELNVFRSETMLGVERRHVLADYIADMKIALVAGHEPRFMHNYKSVLDLIGDVLRSKGVKQGKC